MKLNKIKKKYLCAIIGLGKIGLDYDLYKKDYIQTHSKALFKSKDFFLTSGVDKKKNKLNIFFKNYKKKIFKSLHELKNSKINIDIFIISTPTKYHYKNFIYIINHFRPKVIVCEKPVSFKFKEVEKIINYSKKKKIKFCVNFIRRSDKNFINLKDKIKKKKEKFYGKIFYDKEFYHSCSHYINLMNFWFGKYKGHKILKIYKKNLFDSKLDVIVKFENAEIIFLNTKNKTKKEFILKSKSSNIIKYKNEGIIYNNRKFAFTMKKYQKNFYLELLRYIKNNKNYNLASSKEIMYNAKVIKNILNRNSYGYH